MPVLTAEKHIKRWQNTRKMDAFLYNRAKLKPVFNNAL